jgi:hypothetical protein
LFVLTGNSFVAADALTAGFAANDDEGDLL